MPTLVPEKPQPNEPLVCMVGEPVSASAWGKVTASQIAFLLGRATQFVCANYYGTISLNTSTLTVPVQWRPSPGCRLAALFVEMKSDDIELLGTRFMPAGFVANLQVNVPSGGGLIQTPLLATRGPIDGATEVNLAHPEHANRMTYCVLIHTGNAGDIADNFYDLLVTITPDVGSQTRGIESVCLVELPVSSLRTEENEVGALYPVIDPRNDLCDSDGGNGIGVPYFVTGEQACATRVRTHFQVGTYRDTANSWFTASTSYAALNYRHTLGTSYNPTYRLRARRIHGDTMAVTTRIHYAATSSSDVEITTTPRGGSASTTTINLPSTGGAFAVASSTALSLSNTGTDQEIDISYRFKTTSGTLYVASIAHIQTEA